MTEVANSQSPAAQRGPVLAMASDLIFESRIRATGAAVGVPVITIRTPEAAAAHLAGAAGAIIDLELDAAAEFIRLVVQQRPGLSIAGYFPHVRAEIGRQARELGVSRTYTRSQFTEKLPQLLVELSQSKPD